MVAELQLPLKRPKEGDLCAGLLSFCEARGIAPDATFRAGAESLQQMRNRLGEVKLTVTTADDAAAEFLRQEARLRRLTRRLEEGGAELGQQFKWRDAWVRAPPTRAEHVRPARS